MKKILIAAMACAFASFASAKLPAPSDEARAKAAEAAAKAAHGNKVADFQLCRSREKAAAHYYKSAKAAGKETKPPMETPACVDPGAFVYTPPEAPTAAAPAAAAAPAPAPAASAVPARKP